MELSLVYTEHISGKLAGAFIRGSSPGAWLRELDAWKIDVSGLSCFIVPESAADIRPSGLFVIFSGEALPDVSAVLHPYQCIAGKLFLPLHTELRPQVPADELKKLLLWDTYVFHPVAGLVGFAQDDRVSPASFVALPPFTEKDWGRAHPGNPPPSALSCIQLEDTTPEELLKALQEEVRQKPLKDIKGEDEKSTPFSRFLDTIGRGGLKTGLFVTGLLSGEDRSGTGTPGKTTQPGDDGPGLLNRFRDWMQKKLDDIEKRREDEIKRLLRMFEENPQEALKYALPLDSRYHGRGQAPQGWLLGRRNTDFNLGRLGGGGPADYWDIGNYYSDLRTKYLRMAQQETAAGNHRRAAYIYAHLMGDFHSAANVLIQGKHYRDAAALYLKHLNNKPAAAECLEKGGLLSEAIPFYIELKQHEKAGDLFRQLGQDGQALEQYRSCVDTSRQAGHYLEAARITGEKIGERKEAQQLLLEGWSSSVQADACLMRYFDNAAADGKNIDHEIRSIYALHTPVTKQNGFLNAMMHVAQKNREASTQKTARDIAYEIISGQAVQGNTDNLHRLGGFVGDRLIGGDCSRYAFLNKTRVPQYGQVRQVELDKRVRWLTFIPFRHYLLALGTRANALHLVRATWNGGTEYHTWNITLRGNEQFTFVADARFIDRALLYCNTGLFLERAYFMKNENFGSETIVESPRWLPGNLFAFGIPKERTVITLGTPASTAVICHHMDDGRLVKTNGCTFGGNPVALKAIARTAELLCRNEWYYFNYVSHVCRMNDAGEIESVDTGNTLGLIAVSLPYTELRIASVTSGGFYLLHPTFTGMGEAKRTDISHPVIDLKFLPDNRLVVATPGRLFVYDTQGEAKLNCEITCDQDSVAVLPGPAREQCSVLHASGKISVHNVH